MIAGEDSDETVIGARLRAVATFLRAVDPSALYAGADLFVFPSAAEPFGQAILQAQASGLPVLAAQSARASELIENGRSGCLVPAEPGAVADAIRGLARRATLRARLARGGLLAAHERPLERSLRQLSEGYALALGRLGMLLARSCAA